MKKNHLTLNPPGIGKFFFYFLLLYILLSTNVNANVNEGDKAPNFTLKSNTGKNLRLSEYRGNVVLVNFWASWCGPCRQELPLLDTLYQKYSQFGFVTLGINIDDTSENAEPLLQNLNISFPILYDNDKTLSRLYQIDAMPSTFIIDQHGEVRHIHHGFLPGYEKIYEKQIRTLIAE